MTISLGELATTFGCELIGDPDVVVDHVASLGNADSRSLTFLSNPAFKTQLSGTSAGAVILRPDDADASPVPVLLAKDPYACYARMAAVLYPAQTYAAGIHATAVVGSGADVSDSAHIAANATIDADARIGDNAYVGPGCVVGPGCIVGDHTRLLANVTLARAVTLGARCIIHPGAVIGADGFGNAMTPEGWVKVPQVGGVVIGDDVEIGANTTIDCGAIEDTVLEDGVRIDNLCMVGHNVRIGAHTAMAAHVALAGSAVIGKRCLLAGKSGTVGHITVCDDVVLSGKCMVSKDIKEPGVYASSFPQQPLREWNRQVARVRRLGALGDRVKKLEDSGK